MSARTLPGIRRCMNPNSHTGIHGEMPARQHQNICRYRVSQLINRTPRRRKQNVDPAAITQGSHEQQRTIRRRKNHRRHMIGDRRHEWKQIWQRPKSPSLRNVERTAPYFHDGSAATLTQAVQVMARYQLGRKLADEQVLAIIAFLKSLSGELAAAGPDAAHAGAKG